MGINCPFVPTGLSATTFPLAEAGLSGADVPQALKINGIKGARRNNFFFTSFLNFRPLHSLKFLRIEPFWQGL